MAEYFLSNRMGPYTYHLAEDCRTLVQQQRMQLLKQTKQYHASHPKVLQKLIAWEQARQVSPMVTSGYGLFAAKGSANNNLNTPAKEGAEPLLNPYALK